MQGADGQTDSVSSLPSLLLPPLHPGQKDGNVWVEPELDSGLFRTRCCGDMGPARPILTAFMSMPLV